MLDKSIFALSYCMAHCISFGNCFYVCMYDYVWYMY